MTGEWEFKLRQMEHNKFPATSSWPRSSRDQGHRRAREGLRGGRLRRPRDRHHLPDRRQAAARDPPRLQIAGWRTDGLQGHRRPPHGGGRGQAARRDKQIGPLDGFISAKTRSRFSAVLKLDRRGDEEGQGTKEDVTPKSGRPPSISATRWTSARSRPSGPTRRPGAELCEVGSSYVLRERDGDGAWKQTFRVGRMMCQKPIPAEQAIQLIGDGKTDLIKAFISKKGRPFDAFLKREGARIAWEFPPRAPKTRQGRQPDRPQGQGAARPLQGHRARREQAAHRRRTRATEDAYYVRKPDQDNRQVFKLRRATCARIDIPGVDEARKLVEDGRTGLIEGFVSKRGAPSAPTSCSRRKRTKPTLSFRRAG
jgi:DNA topoisomerase-3